MSRNQRIGGVNCAVLLPRDGEGVALWGEFDKTLDLLLAAGVDGLCVNGATGEYAGATAGERREAVARARKAAGGKALVISGEGGTTFQETVQRAREAEEEGVDAHLVPVPHFFPYAQGDVAEFYKGVVKAVEKPVLIYNLPQFAGGVAKETALDLIRNWGVAGIKDSSGQLNILEALSGEGPVEAVRFVGNDGVLTEAMERGWCNGMISGVAGVLPELNVGMWEAGQRSDKEQFATASRLLDEFIEKLGPWPTPWGLKLAAECRGLGAAALSMPLTEERRALAEEFKAWFEPWWAAASETLAGAKPRV